jgi:hypothetical protein
MLPELETRNGVLNMHGGLKTQQIRSDIVDKGEVVGHGELPYGVRTDDAQSLDALEEAPPAGFATVSWTETKPQQFSKIVRTQDVVDELNRLQLRGINLVDIELR